MAAWAQCVLGIGSPQSALPLQPPDGEVDFGSSWSDFGRPVQAEDAAKGFFEDNSEGGFRLSSLSILGSDFP